MISVTGRTVEPTLETLCHSYYCCEECGTKWGTKQPGSVSTKKGSCHVCGSRKDLYNVKAFDNLVKGIQQLDNQFLGAE